MSNISEAASLTAANTEIVRLRSLLDSTQAANVALIAELRAAIAVKNEVISRILIDPYDVPKSDAKDALSYHGESLLAELRAKDEEIERLKASAVNMISDLVALRTRAEAAEKDTKRLEFVMDRGRLPLLHENAIGKCHDTLRKAIDAVLTTSKPQEGV